MTIVTEDLRDLADELDALRASREADDTDRADDDRLSSLEALEDELGGELRIVGENYEPTMILKSTFVEYARELAEDIGAIPDGNTWPLYCIDWERAADELRMDYTSVRFDGDDYLIRSW
jgi:antirestriction protein